MTRFGVRGNPGGQELNYERPEVHTAHEGLAGEGIERRSRRGFGSADRRAEVTNTYRPGIPGSFWLLPREIKARMGSETMPSRKAGHRAVRSRDNSPLVA